MFVSSRCLADGLEETAYHILMRDLDYTICPTEILLHHVIKYANELVNRRAKNFERYFILTHCKMLS